MKQGPPASARSRIRSLELPPFDPLNLRAAELRAAGHSVISLGQAVPFFPRLHWTPTRGGLFAFARVDGCDDSAALSGEVLDRAHVVTIPGAAFGESGEGFLRLSYGYATADDLADAAVRPRRFFAAQALSG